MRQHSRRFVLIAALAACGPAEIRPPAAAPADAVPAAQAGITLAAFRQLRWLEGRWRGEEPGGRPFFEGYRFENDSTIRSYNYADATSPVPTDSGGIVLRAGQVTRETRARAGSRPS